MEKNFLQNKRQTIIKTTTNTNITKKWKYELKIDDTNKNKKN